MSFLIIAHGLGMGAGGAAAPVTGNPRLSHPSVNLAVDAVCSSLDDGYLVILDGTQPDYPDDAITTQAALATLRYSNPAFGAAVNGVATATSIAPDISADASGTATWFRTYRSDGTTPVFDGSVGVSNATLVLSSVTISAGDQVDISSHTFQFPRIDPHG